MMACAENMTVLARVLPFERKEGQNHLLKEREGRNGRKKEWEECKEWKERRPGGKEEMEEKKEGRKGKKLKLSDKRKAGWKEGRKRRRE